MTTFLSVALGVRMSILPRFALTSFERALRWRFFRTAVEILVLSGIPVSNKTIEYLLDQCLVRGYFARAALLAPRLTSAKRKSLFEILTYCDQLELAEAVAELDGGTVPEQTAAHIANRLQGVSLREQLYASRIKRAHELAGPSEGARYH